MFCNKLFLSTKNMYQQKKCECVKIKRKCLCKIGKINNISNKFCTNSHDFASSLCKLCIDLCDSFMIKNRFENKAKVNWRELN